MTGYSDFGEFFRRQGDTIMGGLGGYQEPGTQQPAPDYNTQIIGDLQKAYDQYGVLGMGFEGLKHGLGGAARGMATVGQPVASGLQQVGQYAIGQGPTEALGSLFTGGFGGEAQPQEAPAQAPSGPPPGGWPQMPGLGAPYGAPPAPPPAQPPPARPAPRGGAPSAPAGPPSAPPGGTPRGSIYDLPPFASQGLEQYKSLQPPETPKPPPQEELLRVLGGLAAGASQWTPGPGGVARSIAAAGAGGLAQGLGFEQELRQATFADEQARQQHAIQGIALESNMRMQAAEMSLKQQAIEAQETYNQLRMMSEQAKAFRASHKISAIAGTGGIRLYDQAGNSEWIPDPMSPVGIMEHADKLKALGTPQTGVNKFITENLALAQDMPDGLRENYTLATHAVFNEMVPDHLAALREQLSEDPLYGMTLQAASQGDEMAISELRRREVMAFSNLLEHNPEMREYIKGQVGPEGMLGASPGVQGLRFLLGD